VEGGKEMNDVLLGTIVGGLIAVAGAAVVACIQGYYSLKSKKEDSLILQQQQARQIQHDKNMELLRRIIEVRAKYLDPLSTYVGKLQNSLSDFQDKLFDVIVPYQREENEIREGSEIRKKRVVQVEAAKKQEFIQQLKSVDSIVSEIQTTHTRIQDTSFNATDMNLRELLKDVVFKVYSLTIAYHTMRGDLGRSKTGQDFIYDFGQIIEPMKDVYISISHAHRRIESLLAGADAGAE